jgi:hypothetical protein
MRREIALALKKSESKVQYLIEKTMESKPYGTQSTHSTSDTLSMNRK